MIWEFRKKFVVLTDVRWTWNLWLKNNFTEVFSLFKNLVLKIQCIKLKPQIGQQVRVSMPRTKLLLDLPYQRL